MFMAQPQTAKTKYLKGEASKASASFKLLPETNDFDQWKLVLKIIITATSFTTIPIPTTITQ